MAEMVLLAVEAVRLALLLQVLVLEPLLGLMVGVVQVGAKQVGA